MDEFVEVGELRWLPAQRNRARVHFARARRLPCGGWARGREHGLAHYFRKNERDFKFADSDSESDSADSDSPASVSPKVADGGLRLGLRLPPLQVSRHALALQ